LTWAHIDGTHKIFVEAKKPGFERDEDPAYIINAVTEGWNEVFEVIVSTQNRPVPSLLDTSTGKYTGTLEYPSSKLTFTSDEELDVNINLRRKGETSRVLPTDSNPAGIYLDINIASGELSESTEVLLEVNYSRDDIPAGMNEENLRLFRYNEDTGEWDLLPNQEIDTSAQVIRVILTGFSEFGVFEIDSKEPAPSKEDKETIPKTGSTSILPVMLVAVVSGSFLFRRKKEV
jgi:LPXTG-motif cell wall-anchored protein